MVVRLGDAVGMGLVGKADDVGFLPRLRRLVEETGAYKVLKDYPVEKLPGLGVDGGNMDVVVPAIARCYGVHAGPVVDEDASRETMKAMLAMMGIDPSIVGSVNGVPLSDDAEPSNDIDNGEGLVLNVPLVRELCEVADLGRAGCDVVEHFTRLMPDYPRWMSESPANLEVTRDCARVAGELQREDWDALTSLMWAVADPLVWSGDVKDAPKPGSKGYDLWLLNHRPDPRNDVVSIILSDGFGEFLEFAVHAAKTMRARYRAPFWDAEYLDKCAALGQRPDPDEVPMVGWPDRYGYLDDRIMQLARRFVLEYDWYSLNALVRVMDVIGGGDSEGVEENGSEAGTVWVAPALGKRVKLPLSLFTGLDRSEPVEDQLPSLVAGIPFTDHPEDIETIGDRRVDELFDEDGMPRPGYVPKYDPDDDEGDGGDDAWGAFGVEAPRGLGPDAAPQPGGSELPAAAPDPTGADGGRSADASKYIDDVSAKLSSFFLEKAKKEEDSQGHGQDGTGENDEPGSTAEDDAATSQDGD